jgi:hypothetical protein
VLTEPKTRRSSQPGLPSTGLGSPGSRPKGLDPPAGLAAAFAFGFDGWKVFAPSSAPPEAFGFGRRGGTGSPASRLIEAPRARIRGSF